MRSSITEIKVQGFHTDHYQHVNNARYLEFLETARWSYYADIFESELCKQHGWAFIIVNINISYKKAAKLGDLLEVHTQPQRMTNATVTLQQQVRLQSTQQIIANAAVTFVVLSTHTNKPLPIKGELKKLLEMP